MGVFQKFKNLKKIITTGLGEFYRYFIDSMVEASEKCRDLKKTNLELAEFHLKQANFSDSILRYWMITHLFKVEDEAVFYKLGLAYLFNNSRGKAINMLHKAYKLNSHNSLCKFRISALEKPDQINEVPIKIIEEDYNIWASIYSKLVSQTKYIAPEVLINEYKNFIEDHSEEALEIVTAYDLGCGYGVAGYLATVNFKIENLYGVDIAENMLAKAKQLNESENIFKQFYHHDFMKFSGYTTKADLVIACYSLQFAADLHPFLKKFKSISHKKAHLIFALPLSKSKKTCYNENLRQFEYTVSDVEKALKAEKFSKIKVITKNISSQHEAILAMAIK